MKKVLHVLPMNKFSGAEKMALLICKNLKRHEAIVVCGGEELAKVFRRNNIKTYVLNFSNKKIISILFGLKKIVKKSDIKLIHAHDNTASFNSYLTKKIFGLDVKVISHIHNCYPWLKSNGINKKIDSIVRPKYDLDITCGNLVYDFYSENTTYFNKDKAKKLSNAIDVQEITNIDTNNLELVKNEFNIPKDKKIIGFIGRLDEQKGLIPFIKEFKNHKEKFIDCRFLLVGNGSLENEIRKLIKENNLDDLFILTGFQKDVYKFYPVIDIFFLPSLYEGLPMVILEAMAFKIPVVSMDVGSIDEVINNGVNGFLVKDNNLNNFINNLNELKNNFNLIEKFSDESFNIIKRKYKIDKYNNILENLYLEVRHGKINNSFYTNI